MPQGLAPGTVLAETYQIVRLVGQGGMGDVYEARHRRLSGRYAIKVLQSRAAASEEIFARFRREAEITSGLRHPNIVQVVDFNNTPAGEAFLAMEFIEGEELTAAMQRSAPLPVERVLDIAGQVASALAAAHAHGIVHRDLKPQNLFLVRYPGDEREVVKVVDFGISKVREATTKLTREATIMGTPRYMAPEQAQGRMGEIDARTDQFALATIVYEMLSGRAAFHGDAVEAVLYQVVHESPEPIRAFNPAVTEALEAVVARGMAKRRDDRFPSIKEFHRELVRVWSGAGASQPRSERAMYAPTVQAAASGLAATAPREVVLEPTVRLPSTSAPAVPVRNPSTTIGGATGEVAPVSLRGRRPWRTRALVAAAGGAALALAVFVVPRLMREESAATPPRAAAPTPAPLAPPAPASEVTVEVVDAPPGLRATLDGVPAALPLVVPRGSARHTLVFEAPGHEPQRLTVDGTTSRTLSLATMRVAASAPAPEPDRRRPARTPAVNRPAARKAGVPSASAPEAPAATPPPPLAPAPAAGQAPGPGPRRRLFTDF
jgi:serine/threonine-protein kinase